MRRPPTAAADHADHADHTGHDHIGHAGPGHGAHGGHGPGHGHGLDMADRHAHEAEVYDRKADELLATATDADLRVDAAVPPYPNREHVEIMDEAFRRLGPLPGRRILEVGSGSGALAVWLALQGADVVAVDVSEGNVRVGRRKAEASGASGNVTFLHTPVETLDHPDGCYDAIIGNQVLHHFDLPVAMANLARMLAPDGVAVFCEPVLFLPESIRALRYRPLVLRYFPSRVHTPDERAINNATLDVISNAFEHSECLPFQAACRLQNFVELSDAWFARLQRVDRFLLRRVPAARRLSRYALIVLAHHAPPYYAPPVAVPEPDTRSTV